MISKELEGTLNVALKEAKRRRHEYVCLEHLLYALLQDKDASGALLGRIVDRAGERTIVLAMGNPYLAKDYPRIQILSIRQLM